jgi:uncharacterized protein
MGSVAILKAVAQNKVAVDAIVLELPFTRLLDAVRSRLRVLRLPPFPIAEMIVFWGSVQHRVNGFTHNPVTYAQQVKCPTLILQGELDKWTSLAEIRQLFDQLKGRKQLVIFPEAGHQLLVTADQQLWRRSVDQFLEPI